MQNGGHLFVSDSGDSIRPSEDLFEELNENVETVFAFAKVTPIMVVRSGQKTIEGPLNPSSDKVNEVGFNGDDVNAVFCEGPNGL